MNTTGRARRECGLRDATCAKPRWGHNGPRAAPAWLNHAGRSSQGGRGCPRRACTGACTGSRQGRQRDTRLRRQLRTRPRRKIRVDDRGRGRRLLELRLGRQARRRARASNRRCGRRPLAAPDGSPSIAAARSATLATRTTTTSACRCTMLIRTMDMQLEPQDQQVRGKVTVTPSCPTSQIVA